MSFEFWWLLGFPLFFILGWLAARIDIKELMSESRGLPMSYFRGLNFLLNEQPDKAIESLLEVAKNDPQTAEIHFALGNLFRRRGEVDRAIKMHQNLLDRPDLDKNQRFEALFELGQDYFKAGFLDRAESLFVKLVGTGFEQRGFSFLVDIYEQEKDWVKAIEAARELQKFNKTNKQKDIANYYCEIALVSLKAKDVVGARKFLGMALRENPLCVRANIELGDMHVKDNQLEIAIDRWRRIEKQNPEYLSLVGQRLFDAYNGLGKMIDGHALLKKYLTKYPAYDLMVVLYDAKLISTGVDGAYELIKSEINKFPTLLTLNKLLDVQLIDLKGKEKNDMKLVKKLISQHARHLSLYFCNSCGFKAAKFHWHCPACNSWETYSPRRYEERERTL